MRLEIIPNFISYMENKQLTWKEKILICKACEFLVKPTYQCGKCGCFVHAKAVVPSAECPLNKWN